MGGMYVQIELKICNETLSALHTSLIKPSIVPIQSTWRFLFARPSFKFSHFSLTVPSLSFTYLSRVNFVFLQNIVKCTCRIVALYYYRFGQFWCRYNVIISSFQSSSFQFG